MHVSAPTKAMTSIASNSIAIMNCSGSGYFTVNLNLGHSLLFPCYPVAMCHLD